MKPYQKMNANSNVIGAHLKGYIVIFHEYSHIITIIYIWYLYRGILMGKIRGSCHTYGIYAGGFLWNK